MKTAAALVMLLLVSTWCLAEGPVITPQSAAADPQPAQEDAPSSLPRYMTPEEALLPPLPVVRDGRPPTGVVHTPAEYEPMQGLFMAWEGYTDILTQMTVYVTTQDPNAMVYMVVDNASEQTSTASALSAAGADMTQVQFVVCTTDSVWIRDYGPRYIFEDGVKKIVDHTYNRPRPNDNAFNDCLCSQWGTPQYDLPLTHGGGNFHLFTNGDAFMSSLILDENPSYTQAQIVQLFDDYENVNLTIYTGFPTSFDSTRHIDMWFFPVGDHKVIVGQYASSTGQPYTITEGAVADLTSRGYTVYRTPGWNSGNTHYTYTNAVIINNQVFISRFGGSYTTQDAQALSVFNQAMPGYTIHQIDNASIIGAAGAMHCIVMHIPSVPPDPNPHVHVLTPNGGETWYVGESHDITWQATDDVGVTSIDISYSTDGGATYPYPIATGEANDGLFAWTVPSPVSSQCRVKVVAHDADGHTGEDVSDANFTITQPPQAIYSFPLDSDPGWTPQGQWAFGHPTGGGSHGRDPNNGHTGTNVYGYNLAGDYTNSMPEYYLTTLPINCTGVTGTQLRFWRWLGVESADHAKVLVSNNNTTWTTVWENVGGSISDTLWSQRTYDISATADNQATVYLRWVMGTTDTGVTYPGWNIDDIEIWGVSSTGACCQTDGSCTVTTQAACTGTWRGAGTTCSPNPCPQPQGACCYPDGSCAVTTVAACSGTWQGAGSPCSPNPCPPPPCPGDANCDRVISWRDIDYFVTGMNDSESAWRAKFLPATPRCQFHNLDVNDDSHVSWRDITPFVARMNTTCP